MVSGKWKSRPESFDLWMVDGFYISEYVAADTLFPVEDFTSNAVLTPEWFDYEDILPAYRLAIASVDGVPYAVPTAGESRFIAYRKDLFAEHGIAPPQTTDELLAAAQYFKENVPGVNGFVSRARTGGFFASAAPTPIALVQIQVDEVSPLVGLISVPNPQETP